MSQLYSFHTHTNWSDGYCSAEEMIRQAVNLGWKKIGISDHLIVHPMHNPGDNFRFPNFDKALDAVRFHLQEIRNTAKLFPEIKVYAGFEVDYFPLDGWIEEFHEFKKKIDADYYINGNHSVTDKSGIKCYEIYHYERYGLPDELTNEYFSNHFINMRNAVLSGEFTFLAHLDYARWSGLLNIDKYKDEINGVISALKQTGMPTEINTKGHDSIGSFYPCPWILKELIAANVPFVISDDAHHTSHLGRYFDEAESMLNDFGCTHHWSL